MLAFVIKGKKSQHVKCYSSDGTLLFSCKTGKDRALAIANFEECKTLALNPQSIELISKTADNHRHILKNADGKRFGSQPRFGTVEDAQTAFEIFTTDLQTTNIL
jgi:hypothetical protein